MGAEAIELEITETTLLRNPHQAVRQLEVQAGLGFSLAIDDVGTCCSSLAILLLTLAEGVETQRQVQSQLELGCDQFQGCLFGRPQTTESFEQTLADLAGGLEARQLTS